MRHLPIALILIGSSAPGTGQAQQQEDVFTLGQITVSADRLEQALDDTTATRDEMQRFATVTLDDAVKLTPGVMSTLDGNGRRNEHNIFVRGFGRLQVPLSIDGVRVYLPADNRLDFRRFLTGDLAQVQVSKGYVSVIDGPGAMGGAINLVTRKPVQPFEGEVRLGATTYDGGGLAARDGYAMVGGRSEYFYAQASASALDRRYWRLSDDFRPSSSIEDGGRRERSASRDTRVNFKLGFTPNEQDEYSLSFTRQQGRKGAPLNVHNDPPVPPNSYWDWPLWNIENLYLLSDTQLGDKGYLKTRWFYNEFDNALYAYDDTRYASQNNMGRFRSYYFDRGYGGSAELGLSLLPDSQTRLALHYRDDKHAEYSINRPTDPVARNTDPVTRTREQTWSLALEHTWHASEQIDVIAGASYNRNRVLRAEDYDRDQGIFEYPHGGSRAIDGQIAGHWRYRDDGLLRASVSSRTRFPTMFERFSTRFGTAVPNPNLGTERALQYELAWERQIAGAHMTAAVFHAELADTIQTVVVATEPEQLTQTRNVGDGRYNGFEFGGRVDLSDTFALGGNFTWLKRRIRDPLQPQLRPVGAPDLQGLLYAAWQPTAAIAVTPSVEFAGDRWSDAIDGVYVRTGDYVLANLQVQVQANEQLAFELGARNLFDQNYALAWGFPEPGRSVQALVEFSF